MIFYNDDSNNKRQFDSIVFVTILQNYEILYILGILYFRISKYIGV